MAAAPARGLVSCLRCDGGRVCFPLSSSALVLFVALAVTVESASRSRPPPHHVLGVPRDASERQVKKAYHKASLKFHPDKCGTDSDGLSKEECAERFNEVSQAYETLTSSEEGPDPFDLFSRGHDWSDSDDGIDIDILDSEMWSAISKTLVRMLLSFETSHIIGVGVGCAIGFCCCLGTIVMACASGLCTAGCVWAIIFILVQLLSLYMNDWE